MKLLVRCVAGLVLTAALTACGGEETVMPDLTAKRLDIALSDLERAGYGDEPEVLGGGMFGVVDQSNWTVCDQSPAPGESVTNTPRLTVDRSCEGLDTNEGEDTQVADESSEEPSPVQQVRKPNKKPRRASARPAAETFVMPFLVGANLQDAQDRLQSLGSFLLTQNDATGLERFQMLDSGWKVCAQIPAAGMKVSLARMVDLRVVKLHESCP
jgi:beta-lactam-binding protein with PASTA domain